jgi:hypothetical protein
MHPRDAQQLRSPSLVGACPHQSFDQQAAVLLDQRRPVTDERISSSKSIDTDESNPTVSLLLHILASVADSVRELIQKCVRTGIKSAKHYVSNKTKARHVRPAQGARDGYGRCQHPGDLRDVWRRTRYNSSFQSLLILGKP